jgi:RNA polymerase sigma factor (sigma-70 family)
MGKMRTSIGAAEQTIDSECESSDGTSLSFEEFFEAERSRLFRALYLMTGNTHEAEELTQDAFMKMWERWALVREMTNPAGYLYTAGVNAYRSRVRRLVRAAKSVAGPSGGEDPFAAADLRDQMVQAIRDLAPRQRAAVVITDLLDHSIEDAARMLGVRPTTVRNLLAQARTALKLAIGDER